MNGKIFSGGALMLALRCTTKTSGLVAARMSTPATPINTTAPMMRAIFSTVAPSRVALRAVPHGTDLDVEIEDAAVRVNLEEVLRPLDRLVPARIVQDCEAADDF